MHNPGQLLRGPREANLTAAVQRDKKVLDLSRPMVVEGVFYAGADCSARSQSGG